MPSYPALIFHKDESGFLAVVFPDLPGCCSCGETLEHAQEMAAEALALYLEGEDGTALPTPSPLGIIPDWLADQAANVAAYVMVMAD